MLIGHSLPTDWTLSITGGAFLTDPDPLQDRKPLEAVQIEWPAGAQTTSTAVQIAGIRGQAFRPRLAALLGTSFRVGQRVEIIGQRSGDAGYTYGLGGNSMTQLLALLPDGSVGCGWVFADGLDPIVAWRITIYNDVGGAVVIEAEEECLAGEVVVCPALDIPHAMGLNESWVDPSPVRRTLAAQIDRVPRTPYRSMTIQPIRGTKAEARGAALVDGMDFQRLLALFARDPYTLCVPYSDTPAEIQSSMIFGVVSGLGIDGLPGRWTRMEKLTLSEVPAAA